MSNKKTIKKIAIGTLLSGAVGFIFSELIRSKSGKKLRKELKSKNHIIDEEIQNKLNILYSELAELITTIEEEFKGSKLKDSKKMTETIDEAHVSRQKLNEIIQAIKTGKSDNKELNLAIKEAEKAINSAKSFLLSK